eukprot:1701312-Rhodomonas_salina.2
MFPLSRIATNAAFWALLAASLAMESSAMNGSVGILLPLRWGGLEAPIEPWDIRYAASAAMAVYHINNRVASLVPKAAQLLPPGFTLDVDMQDSMAKPSVAVHHAVAWSGEGRHAIVGSYRSAVTGPLALAASIEATPVVVWGAVSSSLSDRDLYPTMSRTCASDAVGADRTIRSMLSMGWTRIAILYESDAWGRYDQSDAIPTLRGVRSSHILTRRQDACLSQPGQRLTLYVCRALQGLCAGCDVLGAGARHIHRGSRRGVHHWPRHLANGEGSSSGASFRS